MPLGACVTGARNDGDKDGKHLVAHLIEVDALPRKFLPALVASIDQRHQVPHLFQMDQIVLTLEQALVDGLRQVEHVLLGVELVQVHAEIAVDQLRAWKWMGALQAGELAGPVHKQGFAMGEQVVEVAVMCNLFMAGGQNKRKRLSADGALLCDKCGAQALHPVAKCFSLSVLAAGRELPSSRG